MTMMNSPEDSVFKDMLSGYAAPIDDAGFTDNLLAVIDAKKARLHRMKFLFLASGCFLGGVLAATQFKSALGLLRQISLPEVTIAPIWLLAAALISAFIAWMTLDNKPSGSF